MSESEVLEFAEAVRRLYKWSPEMRFALAKAALESLRPPAPSTGSCGVPADQVRGMGLGSSSPPDDETVKRWVDEHLMEKYG